MRSLLYSTLASCWIAIGAGAGLQVDVDSPDSVRAAAKVVAKNLMSYYHGNEPGQIPGILPGPPDDGKGPYYWWQGGALWGTMIDYWQYTQDTTYNDDTEQSIVWQAGAPQNSFMSPNWTASLGNDDQGFWGMSAMLAAETKFQNPAANEPQWLALAQAVFNTQAPRWDTTECNGGLRWQVYPFAANNGYDYKNTISTGIFFNIAARLARYTGNDTYAEWATKAWTWTYDVGYIDKIYNIYDGANVDKNCTEFNKAQYSYAAAVYVQGAGFMYNYTNGASFWTDHLTALTNRTIEYFFHNGTAVEPICERATVVTCTTDALSFKGYLHRFLAQAAKMAPVVHDPIMNVLRSSAKSAATACLSNGTCGFTWTSGSYDGITGAGQQMNALAALITLLADETGIGAPVTNSTGGTSPGDSGAGGEPDVLQPLAPMSQKDRAGAGVLTAVVIVALVSVLFWVGSQLSERS